MNTYMVKANIEAGMEKRLADRRLAAENAMLRAKLREMEATLAVMLAARDAQRARVMQRVDAIRAENQRVGILRRIWGAMIVREVS